ncbi:glycosyltransferase [Fervidobacterium islandicum]|uniref:Glycosyltransferase n=1 Tax=Fervidobacterium islandicum TaxID=2423 RepID=A0AAI8CKC9_FERIS|nr:glycosyltransferase [Fervidobacterium islandicum]AMW31976.1 glycosyltransferase [Fervidobacterium islandicum]
MRVLQINSVCGVGSTGRIMLQVHNTLKEKGHESYLAYGRKPVRNCEEAIRIGNDLDVYSHVLLTRMFDLHGFGSKKATKEFVKTLEKINPDIIHLHNIHGYYLHIEVLFDFLKRYDKPVVWTLHDCWAFTGHCAHFLYARCDKWKTGCYSCPEKKAYPKSVFLDNSKSNYQRKRKIFTGVRNMTLVTPSQWLAGLVKESFLAEYPVKVIPNGVDVSIFKPTPSDFRKRFGLANKFVILGVANVWDRRKGFDYFLELSKYLSDDEVIVLVGVSDKQIKMLPRNVIGIKRTSLAKELAEIYTAADVFFNPTLEDNYPTVNLEAQACGTYVITFDSGGSSETIVSEKSGMAIKPCSAKYILDLVKSLKSIGTKGVIIESSMRSVISHQFMVNSYIGLYEELYCEGNEKVVGV